MWSLGVTAYLMLSGRYPFNSDEEVLANPNPRFSEVCGRAKGRLVRLVSSSVSNRHAVNASDVHRT